MSPRIVSHTRIPVVRYTMNSKFSVDRHVSHLLSKCSSARERKTLGLEISRLYIDIKDFKTAKGYLERYIQVDQSSPTAFLLLASVSEELGEILDATRAYKKAFELGYDDDLLLTHVCNLVSTNHLPVADMKYWSSLTDRKEVFLLSKTDLSNGVPADENRLLWIESQLSKDPNDADLCMKFLNLLNNSDIERTYGQCLKCINAGYHFDRPEWLRLCVQSLDMCHSAPYSEDLPYLEIISRMLLLRLIASNEPQTDFYKLLESLHTKINLLPSGKEFIRFLNISESWLSFYSGVYIQRFCNTEDITVSNVVYEHYRRSIELLKSEPEQNNGPFSHNVWNTLHMFQQEHSVQAWCLMNALTQKHKNHTRLESAGWDELMNILPKSTSANNSSSNPVISTTPFLEIDGDEFWFHCRDALMNSPNNLALLLWACSHLSDNDSSVKDAVLSDQRLNFIFTFVSAAFPRLELTCSPLPASTRLRSTPVIGSESLCRLDLICFLMSCLVHLTVRILSHTEIDKSQSSKIFTKCTEWLRLPVCLLPSHAIPSSPQRKWWELAMDVVGRSTLQSSNQSRPTRQSMTFFQCGLSQIRLLARSTRCFGNQSGIPPTPLLFRVAEALTRFGERFASAHPKVNILDWANGFWRCALQHQAFGTAPPNATLAAQTNRPLPACCGLGSLLANENSRLCSPSSPLRPANLTAPGSPAFNHSLFSLPNSFNWWIGLDRPFHQDPAVMLSRWYNDGLFFCLSRLDAAYQTSGYQFTADEESELRLVVRLLDQTKIEVTRVAYALAGQLLSRYIEHNRTNGKTAPSSDTASEGFLLRGSRDPLSDPERAKRYLRLAAITYESDEDHPDDHPPDVLNDWKKEVEAPNQTTPFRSQDSPRHELHQLSRDSRIGDAVPQSESTRTASRSVSMRPLYDLFAAFEGCNLIETTTPTSAAKRGAVSSSSTELASHYLNDEELDINVDQFQELLMASVMNNWQSLVNNLSGQLVETKVELLRSRQLNEQLSTQLNETCKQLSETMNKFIEFQTQMNCVTKAGRDVASIHESLADPVRELSQAISELRRWLPEGMAAAATAAVQAHMAVGNARQPTPPRPAPLMNGVDAATLMHLYGSNISLGQPHFAPIQPMPIQSLPPNWRMPTGSAPMTSGAASFGDLRPIPKPAQIPWADAINGVRFGDVNYPPRADQPGLLPNYVPGGAFPTANYGWSGSSPPNRDTSRSHQSDSQTEVSDVGLVKPSQPLVVPASPASYRSPGPSGFGLHPASASGMGAPPHPLDNAAVAAGQPNKSTASPSTIGRDRPRPMPEPGLFRPPTIIASSAEGISTQADPKSADPSAATVKLPAQTKGGLFSFNPLTGHSSAPSVTVASSSGTADSSGKPAIDLLARFAPKPGEWNCSACLVRNSSTHSSCIACQTPKSSSADKSKPASTPTAPAVSSASLLSKFAPQPGSWDCPTCMLNHSATVELCPACKTQKPGLSASAGGDTAATSKPSTTSLFGGFSMTGASGFVFGQQQQKTTAPTASTPSKPLFSFVGSGTKSPIMPSPGTAITFGLGSQTSSASTTNATADKQDHADSGSQPVFFFGKDHPCASTKPPSNDASKSGSVFEKLELTANSNHAKPVFGSGGFSFNFGTPRTTESGGAKATNVSTVANASGDDTDQVELVDEDKLSFKPVLEVMPERVEVRTGEENEEVVFCERAKLYRWTNDIWRERGVGEIKLLRTPATGAVRCLMRRDHVLKVCCNHPVTVGMQLKPMTSAADGRAWTWWAIDFTEPAADADRSTSSETNAEVDASGGRPETFAVRFKSTDHAQAFRAAFQDAVSAAEIRANEKSDQTNSLVQGVKDVDIDRDGRHSDNDDVIVVDKPPKVSNDQLARARQLMLPDEFYSFENGVVRGESERMSAKEEAEEDALLDAAVRKGMQSSESDPSPVKPVCAETSVATSEDSKQNTVIQSTPGSDSQQPAHDGSSRLMLGSLSMTPQEKQDAPTTTYIPQLRGLPDFSILSASVSKDSKPSWVTPSAPSTTSANIWANAGSPLFAKSAPTEATETSENGAAAESGEHDPHYDPIIALPELVQPESGEENEVCLFLRRCRVYRWADKAWKERGVGTMKVLAQPRSIPAGCQPGGREVVPDNVQLGGVQRARLLMRRDQVLKLCVNQPIGVDLPHFTPMASGSNGLCWVGEDYSEGSATHEKLAVRFKNASDAKEFQAAVARAQSYLAKSSS